ncbi:hypothetical protein [Pseudomonas cichorii]|nr:hypothetical protein [Pseudomonas cichorii]
MTFADAEYAGKRKKPQGTLPDRDGLGGAVAGLIKLIEPHYPFEERSVV